MHRTHLLLILAALVALAVGIAGLLLAPERFFQAYLVAFLYWNGIALGCLGWLLLQNLSGARWGYALQRIWEAGARTLLLMGLLFVPLVASLFVSSGPYPWARAPGEGGAPLLLSQASYLNTPFFIVRAVLYFAVWSALAIVLSRWSYGSGTTDDANQNVHIWQDRVRLSAVGLLVFSLAANFAAIDWLMSLQPDWFSSLFGWLAIARHALGGLAFSLLALALVRARGQATSLRPLLDGQSLGDMGAALLATLLTWAYMALMQFMVIWTANKPEEVTWYLLRTRGGWQWLPVALVAGVFVCALLLLLRPAKRRLRLLGLLAALILLLRLVNVYWLVMPVFQPAVMLHWLDLALPLAMGLLWCAAFAWQLLSRPLLPENHPKVQEILSEQPT